MIEYKKHLLELPKEEIIERYLQVCENIEILDASNKRLRKQLSICDVVSSAPNKALKDSQLSDMVTGYKMMCKPDVNFEKYYSKGFTECWEWIKRITK